jgi:hypothetical protein
MKALKLTIAIILAIMALGALLGLRTVSPLQVAPDTSGVQAPGNLRVLSPKSGQSVSQNFVTVRYELLNPAAAASPTPTFQLQLDAADPVRTASTEYTFTGLAPGQHTVMVELVDANNTPIMGSRRTVQFTVAPQTGASVVPRPAQQASLAAISYDEQQNSLPATGSALPLLSVIGFGVLLGGIASALRTR